MNCLRLVDYFHESSISEDTSIERNLGSIPCSRGGRNRTFNIGFGDQRYNRLTTPLNTQKVYYKGKEALEQLSKNVQPFFKIFDSHHQLITLFVKKSHNSF